jgi:hypothetical protein
MTEIVRAKTATGDWCKPTAELPNQELAQLLNRTRLESREQAVIVLGEADRKAVPQLSDPWFIDSGPVEVGPVEVEPVEVDAVEAEPAVIIDRPPVADPPPPVVGPPVVASPLVAPPVVAPFREPKPRTAIQRLTKRLARLTMPRPVVYPIAPSSHAWVLPFIVAVVAAIAVVVAFVQPF